MRLEKHIEALKEVMDEIQASLENSRGLVMHQWRLATMLSLRVCELIEIYFHKMEIMKSGSRIKHAMLRRGDVKKVFSNQIVAPIDRVKHIDVIIDLAKSIEEERDNMAYGSPQPHEELLTVKIQDFLKLKNLIEKEIGRIV
jgi:hypothetical protein